MKELKFKQTDVFLALACLVQSDLNLFQKTNMENLQVKIDLNTKKLN